MDKRYRPCPACDNGRVVCSELHRGTQCSYCHKLIEFDFWVLTGIPLLLALITGFGFRNQIGWLGMTSTVLIVLYTASYQNVLARYLPIKTYED